MKSEIGEEKKSKDVYARTRLILKVEVNYLLQIIGIQSEWIKLSFCSSFLVACPQCYVIMKGEHLFANSSDSPQKWIWIKKTKIPRQSFSIVAKPSSESWEPFDCMVLCDKEKNVYKYTNVK